MDEYTLPFIEAVEKCFNDEGFIRGERFEKGVYVKPKGHLLMIVSVNQQGWHEEISPFNVTFSTALEQKYKLFSVASKRELGLEE